MQSADSARDFSFRLLARDGEARVGEISLPRGRIRTPAFMPVGTAATVKAMLPEQVRALGADVVLGNTYHLMLRPGAERIARLGRFPGHVAFKTAKNRRERSGVSVPYRWDAI